jgi:hypothetical protein
MRRVPGRRALSDERERGRAAVVTNVVTHGQLTTSAVARNWDMLIERRVDLAKDDPTHRGHASMSAERSCPDTDTSLPASSHLSDAAAVTLLPQESWAQSMPKQYRTAECPREAVLWSDRASRAADRECHGITWLLGDVSIDVHPASGSPLESACLMQHMPPVGSVEAGAELHRAGVVGDSSVDSPQDLQVHPGHPGDG